MDRRTVIVAPSIREADAMREQLGIRSREAVLASTPQALRSLAFTEDDLVRVRPEDWSDSLSDTVAACLLKAATPRHAADEPRRAREENAMDLHAGVETR